MLVATVVCALAWTAPAGAWERVLGRGGAGQVAVVGEQIVRVVYPPGRGESGPSLGGGAADQAWLYRTPLANGPSILLRRFAAEGYIGNQLNVGFQASSEALFVSTSENYGVYDGPFYHQYAGPLGGPFASLASGCPREGLYGFLWGATLAVVNPCTYGLELRNVLSGETKLLFPLPRGRALAGFAGRYLGLVGPDYAFSRSRVLTIYDTDSGRIVYSVNTPRRSAIREVQVQATGRVVLMHETLARRPNRWGYVRSYQRLAWASPASPNLHPLRVAGRNHVDLVGVVGELVCYEATNERTDQNPGRAGLITFGGRQESLPRLAFESLGCGGKYLAWYHRRGTQLVLTAMTARQTIAKYGPGAR
jgi:hypothetical protein